MNICSQIFKLKAGQQSAVNNEANPASKIERVLNFKGKSQREKREKTVFFCR